MLVLLGPVVLIADELRPVVRYHFGRRPALGRSQPRRHLLAGRTRLALCVDLIWSPSTAVLPTCSMVAVMSPSAPAIRLRRDWKSTGQLGL